MVDKYIMNNCKHCNTKLIDSKKFCNSSCAALFNNANRSKESRIQQQNSLKNAYDIKYGTENKYCSNCDVQFGFLYEFNSHKLICPNEPDNSNITHTYIRNMEDIIYRNYSKSRHVSKFLNKDINTITWNDFYKFRKYIEHLYYIELLSTSEIKTILNITHSNFAVFLKNTMEIQLRTRIDGFNIYLNNTYEIDRFGKEEYYRKTQFMFDVFKFNQTPGFELIKNGWRKDVHRDHIISRNYGWNNNVSSKLIAHPANCQILIDKDNIRKGVKNDLTLDELIEKIKLWDERFIPEQYKSLKINL